jgi:cell wall-associated NlpC family hydrolase
MPNRADVIAEARKWIGTPFHHQACVCQQGVDCANLIAGVGLALGLVPHPLTDQERVYRRVPDPDRMRSIIAKYLDPVDTPQPGDILHMGWRKGRPMHMGILTDLHGRGIIHALSTVGRVVETSLPQAYMDHVESWWSYRGLD